ncbi:hypothetical protein JCM33374_g268 [Metschnikowia sp. JCM 33374]|nr:hypothetical protein JCM33374_g268 [Metschnikowia sp. JCM 33374]
MTRHSKSKSGLVDSSKFTVAPDHTNTTKRTTCDIESTTKTHNDTNTASCFSALATGSSVDSTTLGASTKASPKALTGTTTQKHKTRKSSKRSKKTKKAKAEKIANDEGQKRPTSTVLKKVVGISNSTTSVPTASISFVDTKKTSARKAPMGKPYHMGLASFGKPSTTSEVTSEFAASKQVLLGAQTGASVSSSGKAPNKSYADVAQVVGSTSPLEHKAKSQSLSYAEIARKAMEKKEQRANTKASGSGKTTLGELKDTKANAHTKGPRYASGQDEGCSRNLERSMTSKRRLEIDADGFQLVRSRRYRPSTKVPVRCPWERYCKRKNGYKHGGYYQKRTPVGPTPLYSDEDKVTARETLGETSGETLGETLGETSGETVEETLGAMVGVSDEETNEEVVTEAEFSTRNTGADEGIEAETGAATISYAYLMTIEVTFAEGVLTKVIVREAIIRETIAAETISTDLFFRETIATRKVAAEIRITEMFGPDLSVPALTAPGLVSPEAVVSEEMRFDEVISEEEACADVASEDVILDTLTSDINLSNSISSGSTESDVIACHTITPHTVDSRTTAIDSKSPATTTSPVEQKAKSQSLSYAEVARKAMEKTAVGAHNGTKVKVPTRGTRSPSGQDEGCSRNHERSMTSKRQHEIDADGFQLVRARRYRPSTKVPVRSAWERYCKRKNGNKNGGHNRRSRPVEPTPLYSGAANVKSRETSKGTIEGTIEGEVEGTIEGEVEGEVEQTGEEMLAEMVEARVGDMIRAGEEDTVDEEVREQESPASDIEAGEGMASATESPTVSCAYFMMIEVTFTESVLTNVIVREAIVRETITPERISTDLFFRETIATSTVTSESRMTEVFGPDFSVPAIMAPGMLSPCEMRFHEVVSDDDAPEVVILDTADTGIMAADSTPSDLGVFDSMVGDSMAPEITAMDSRASVTTNGQMWFATKVALAFMMLSAARDIFQVLFVIWQFAESI